VPPSVWRVEFPPDITSQVLSEKNPDGQLTNSDLEMAGVLLQYLVLEEPVPNLSRRQAVIGCDNSLAVAWMRRMAAQASSPVAHRLLRGLAMRQRTTRAAPPNIFHTAGKLNILADVASRPITNVPVSNPAAFLAYFQRALCPSTVSLLDACPPEFRPVLQCDLDAAWAAIGVATVDDKERSKSWQDWRRLQPQPTPTSVGSIDPGDRTCSFPLPPGFELDSTEKVGRLDTSQWRKPCVTWHKPSNWLATTIQGKPTDQKSWIYSSVTS
jgi:hypothetical protein